MTQPRDQGEPFSRRQPTSLPGTRRSPFPSGQARAACAGALALVLALAGCDTEESETASAEEQLPTEFDEDNPGHDQQEHEHDYGEVEYSGELTDQDIEAAEDRAEEAVAAASYNEDESAWWEALEPLLSENGAMNFSNVDPGNIQWTEVTGEAELAEETATLLVWVEVPTDWQPVQVMLSRYDSSSEWEVERFSYDPPEADGDEDDQE